MNESQFSSRTHCWCTYVFCHEKLRVSLKIDACIVGIVTAPSSFTSIFVSVHSMRCLWALEHTAYCFFFNFYCGRSLHCICCLLSPEPPHWPLRGDVKSFCRGLLSHGPRGWKDTQVQSRKATSVRKATYFQRNTTSAQGTLRIFTFTHNNIILITVFL